MRKIYFLLLTVLFAAITKAQLTGTKNIPGDYPDLATAITTLNTQGVGAGGVVLNLVAGNPQTAPAGGYVVGGAGSLVLTTSSVSNSVTIQGNGNTITASAAQTIGSVTDAIFKLIGADWVTLQGFTLQENAANTVTAVATNNMTEWGVALLHASTTDGAQNNTIQNNTISLNRTYGNTFGIYSNTCHSATVPGTIEDITAASGENSPNKVYNNQISNINFGIVFLGSNTPALMDNSNDIGGVAAGTGNTINNWGGLSATAATFINLTGNNACIGLWHQYGYNVSWNTITSASLTVTTLTTFGIISNYPVAVPAGSFTNTITNNTVTVTLASTTTGGIIGIDNTSTIATLVPGATVNINNNTVSAQISTGTTAQVQCIINAFLAGSMNINNNLIANSINNGTTVGSAGFFNIINSVACNNLTINANTIRGNSSSTVAFTQMIENTGLIPGTINITNNNLGDATAGALTMTAAATSNMFGIINTGGTATTTLNITGNTLRGFSFVSSGGFNPINLQGTSCNIVNINNNNLGVATAGGSLVTYSAAQATGFTGIGNSVATTGGTININNNSFRGINFASTGPTVTGISQSGNWGVAGTININTNNFGTGDNGSTGAFVNFNAAQASAVTGITNTGGTSSALTINGNNFQGINHVVAGSAAHTYITNTAAPLTMTLSNNTFTNLNVNTTGTCTFISHAYSVPSGGSQTFNNNSIVTGYNRGGASGSVIIMTSGSSSAPGTIINHTNNNFSNITVAGTTTLTGISNSDGATSPYPIRTVTGNIFNNWTAVTGTISVVSYAYFGGSSSVSGNTITNITGQGTITGLTINNSGAAASPLTISSNTITGLSSTGTGGTVTALTCANSSPIVNVNSNTINSLSSTGASSSVLGITITGATATNVFANTINTLSGSGATSPLIRGISVSSGTTVNVYKNKIYDLSLSAAIATTAGAVNGLLLSGGTTVTAYNNLIGDLRTPTANLTDAIRGINITSASASTNYNVYFNTVYLNASSTGANFGTTGIFHTISTTATTATLNLRNNIIVNNSTPTGTGLTVAYRRSAGAANNLANYASTSNNNLFYAGTPGASNLIYADGTSSAQTMVAYKSGVFTAGTISPRDNVSVTENPPFLSTTGSSANFLHINTTIATQVESGGASISSPFSITDDFDGDTRNVTTPDIGADEFTGILLDLTGPSINYTTFGNTSCLTDKTLSPVTITDASGVNITTGTRPRLYFKKSTNANAFNDNTNGTDGWKYVEATGAGSSPFSFTTNYSLLFGGAGVSLGDIIQYFVVAQDLAGTPNVSINSGTFTATPSSVALTAAAFPITGTINSYTLVAAGLTGTVTIGAAGTYTSLTGAAGLFNAINTNGLSGNLTANIVDASVTETGAVALNVINYNGCAAGPYTITIKPNAAVTTVLSGTVASGALIKLNGADFVTIDGSNNGSTSQNMTITNSSAASPTGLWISSLGTGVGATNNTIKNCIINTGSNTATSYGIFAGGVTIGTAGDDNDNLTIQNNTITKSYYGINIVANATGVDNNLVISGNTIGSLTAANAIGFAGLVYSQADGAVVSGNEIFGITTTLSFDAVVIGSGVTNSSFTSNRIHDLVNNGTNRATGINIGSGTLSNLTFANNVLYGIINNGTGGNSFGCYGFYLTAGTGYNFYFNSVNMSGDRDAVSATKPTSISAAFMISSASVLNIRNNVFVNTQAAVTNVPKSYAIYSTVANSSFTTINYNDYFASGAQGMLGFLVSDQATIALWRTASGQDINSISADPLFNSATNLQPQPGTPLAAAGVAGTGITTDISGIVRGNPPTIGAYEQSADVVGPTITYSPLAGTLCIANRTISATITDASGVNSVAGTKPRIYFKKSTNANVLGATNTNTTDGWKYTEATNASSPFSLTIDYSLVFGGVAAGETVQYFVVAQDLSAIPNVSINSGSFAVAPSSVALTAAAFPIGPTINSYALGSGGLSGVVTIGAAGTYTSLTGAGGLFSVLNAGGLTGNLTVNIIDASVTENGANALNALNYGCAGPYTILIKPATTATLTGSVASGALIKLNGASYVTIDGSNSGGTDRSLTITNSNTTSPTAVSIASLGTGSGATNNTIKNCNISTGVSAATGYGISVGGSTPGTGGADNDNTTIQNNAITVATVSIYANGTAAVSSGGMDNLLIVGNSINTNTNIQNQGIQVGNGLNGSITGNTISVESSGAVQPVGISIETGFVSSSVTKNVITKVLASNTGGYGGRGITIGTGTTSSNLTISNNMIYGVNGTNWSGFSNSSSIGIGIGVLGGGSLTTTAGGVNLYYNTVNMFGSYVGATSSDLTAALYIGSSTSALNIMDNIFFNQLNNTTTGGTPKQYAVYSAAPNTVFTNINYNDYATSGTQGVLGFLGTDQTTIAAWRTATGQDANSINVVPVFVSNTDLHLVNTVGTNWCLNGSGIVIPGITTDIDGDIRSAGIAPNGPDMGVDEFVAVGDAAATPASQTICSGSAISTISFTGTGTTFTWTRDNTVSVTGIAASGSGNITGSLTNTTSAPVTVTFTIRPSSGGCTGPAFTATVLVNPTPNAVATPSSQTICSGTAITTIALTGSVTGTTFNWTRDNTVSVTGIAASGSGDISGSLTNTSFAPITVTFTITPTANGCPGTPITATVLVNPTPNAVATPSSQTICSTNSITTIVLSSSAAGTTFTWTRDNTISVTGIAASGAGDISGALTNTTFAPVTVTFTITPLANGCPGTPTTATVLVNPTPDAMATPSSQTACSGTAITSIVLSSSVAGTTFNWTRDNTITVTGMPASGSGNINGSLTNPTGLPITVTFTITPSAAGCPGTPTTATVTVNPLPTISGALTQPTTCVSTDGAIALTLGGAPGPYTFSWTTNGGSGLVPTQQDQTGLTVGQYTVLVTAANGCQQTAVFNLTGPGGCSICPSIGSFTSNPTPSVCAGTNVTLTASGLTFMGITYGITFKYSNTPLADPYAGGTIIATVDNGSLTSGGTVAATSTSFASNGNYYIYAIISPTPVDPLCRPSSVTYLQVNQNPSISSVTATPNPVCVGSTSQLNANVNPIAPGYSFTPFVDYGVQANAGPTGDDNVSGTLNIGFPFTYFGTTYTQFGISTNGNIQLGAGPYDAAFTNQSIPDVTSPNNYIGLNFDDWYQPGGGNITYATVGVAPNRELIVSYNGIPPFSGTGNLTGQIVLYETSNLVDLVSVNNTTTTGGTEGVEDATGATGLAVTGRNDANFSVTNETYRFSTGSSLTYSWTAVPISAQAGLSATNIPNPVAIVNTNATYTVAVTDAGSGCSTSQGVAVTTNPIPTVNAVANQTVCNGSSTATVSFSGFVPGTVFNWTNNTVSIGLAASGTGNIASFVATNAGTTPVTATITVTPSYTNGGTTCTGTPTSFTITVNPTPTVNAVGNQTICNGASTTAVTFSGAVAGTVFNWTNNTASIGLAASGTGNIASFVATNAGTAPVTATVTVTPIYTNAGTTCTGTPTTFTITVNPTATVNAVANQVVCNNSSTTAVAFSSPTTGGSIVYNWTNNTPSIGLAASGTGNIASFVATNATNAPVVATITVTPSYTNGVTCTGTPRTFTITVNPTPTVNAVANQTLCAGSATTAVSFSGAVTGTVFNWTNNTVSIGLAASGTGNIASFIAINNGTTPVVATITVTPSYTNAGVTCNGTPITFTITVNPRPTVTCPANIVVNATAGTCSAVVNYPPATATGTPAPVITYSIPSGSTFPVGVTTITVTATNTCGVATCTFNITVNDVQLPVITTQPVNQSVCVGSNATFTVVATNVSSYQWQAFNGTSFVNIAGANSASYTVSNVTLSMNPTSFRVILTGLCSATTTSAAATLFVNPLPTISLSASPATVILPTQTTTITANAVPPGGTYVWFLNGVIIPGATGSVLGGINVDKVGTYKVVYTDPNGCVSTSANLVISAAASSNLYVYPNPNTGQFHIRFNNLANDKITVLVFDSRGALVYRREVNTTLPYTNIDVNLGGAISAGVFVVEIRDSAGNLVGAKRIIVEHP